MAPVARFFRWSGVLLAVIAFPIQTVGDLTSLECPFQAVPVGPTTTGCRSGHVLTIVGTGFSTTAGDNSVTLTGGSAGGGKPVACNTGCNGCSAPTVTKITCGLQAWTGTGGTWNVNVASGGSAHSQTLTLDFDAIRSVEVTSLASEYCSDTVGNVGGHGTLPKFEVLAEVLQDCDNGRIITIWGQNFDSINWNDNSPTFSGFTGATMPYCDPGSFQVGSNGPMTPSSEDESTYIVCLFTIPPGTRGSFTVGVTVSGVQSTSVPTGIRILDYSITSTATSTPSVSSTTTRSMTPTISATTTKSVTVTSTLTATPTRSLTNTRSASTTISETSTNSATPTPTQSATPTRSATATATQTGTGTASITVTRSSSPTRTPTSTLTVTPSATRTPSQTGTATPSETATTSFTTSSTPSFTTSATRSPTGTRTGTRTGTTSPTRTASFTTSPTPTTVPTHTPTASLSPTRSATPTPSATDTVTGTSSETTIPHWSEIVECKFDVQPDFWNTSSFQPIQDALSDYFLLSGRENIMYSGADSDKTERNHVILGQSWLKWQIYDVGFGHHVESAWTLARAGLDMAHVTLQGRGTIQKVEMEESLFATGLPFINGTCRLEAQEPERVCRNCMENTQTITSSAGYRCQYTLNTETKLAFAQMNEANECHFDQYTQSQG